MYLYSFANILIFNSSYSYPTARERKVSSTRLQRMISFGTLGIGLGVGTAAEYTWKMLGLKEKSIENTVDNVSY